MTRWLGQGPSVVVVTLGADGVAYRVAAGPTRAGHRRPPAPSSTPSAPATRSWPGWCPACSPPACSGDPGARERLRGATLEDVRPAVDRGMATSGVTVGKAGAYAPALDEL